jgi:uncharacterized protein (DUF433 family)
MNDQNASHSIASALPTTSTSNGEGIIMRSDLGPTIAGTRINIYDVMDYLHEEWPPKLIRDWLGLSDAQINSALAYIHENRDRVEKEYRELEQQAKEDRRYWEEYNRNRPKPPQPPDTAERAALRAKLEALKNRLPKE